MKGNDYLYLALGIGAIIIALPAIKSVNAGANTLNKGFDLVDDSLEIFNKPLHWGIGLEDQFKNSFVWVENKAAQIWDDLINTHWW